VSVVDGAISLMGAERPKSSSSKGSLAEEWCTAAEIFELFLRSI
jgi:hypothetical protein